MNHPHSTIKHSKTNPCQNLFPVKNTRILLRVSALHQRKDETIKLIIVSFELNIMVYGSDKKKVADNKTIGREWVSTELGGSKGARITYYSLFVLMPWVSSSIMRSPIRKESITPAIARALWPLELVYIALGLFIDFNYFARKGNPQLTVNELSAISSLPRLLSGKIMGTIIRKGSW